MPSPSAVAPSRCPQAIPFSDPYVAAVTASRNAKVLRPGSTLGTTLGHGAVAAIRMSMLRASNFVNVSSSRSDEQGRRRHLRHEGPAPCRARAAVPATVPL
jgi:hypothetical protein